METGVFSLALAALFGGWEIVLILAVVLIIFYSYSKTDEWMRGLREDLETFKRATSEATDELEQPLGAVRPPSIGSKMILFFAQGFGAGRIPFAPGTFGSLVGLLWTALLLATGSLWLYLAGIMAGFALSVWLCGAAEKILRQKDPGSVVLDEITAMPVCFLGFIGVAWVRHGQMPPPENFFGARTWFIALILFALFRVFDIFKPWPVRQSQSLPGGWGVTVDDFLAALCVALLTLVVAL